jgi:anthranilate O-methyltransferase
VPGELSRGIVLNEGNIYIWEVTPPSVVKLYRKQFQEDFLLFLKLRHGELGRSDGGHVSGQEEQ